MHRLPVPKRLRHDPSPVLTPELQKQCLILFIFLVILFTVSELDLYGSSTSTPPPAPRSVETSESVGTQTETPTIVPSQAPAIDAIQSVAQVQSTPEPEKLIQEPAPPKQLSEEEIAQQAENLMALTASGLIDAPPTTQP